MLLRAIKDSLNQSPDFASKNGFPDHHEKKWIQDNFLEFVSPPHARDYLAIWPPNTQRKCMAESKLWLTGDKCRDAVEFLKVSSAILISCFSSTNVTDPAFHRCLFSKLGSYNALYYRLEIQNLHAKQMLIGHSRQHNRDIPSAAIAWGRAPCEALFDQFSRSMLISSPC